jgi:hypothetical protein
MHDRLRARREALIADLERLAAGWPPITKLSPRRR